MLLDACESRVVRNAYLAFGPEDGVVLVNQDPRREAFDGFGHPVVDAVEVDGQDGQIWSKAAVSEQLVDVVSGDEGLARLEGMLPVKVRGLTRRDIVGRAIHHESAE